MKRLLPFPAMLAILALAACAPSEAAVRAAIEATAAAAPTATPTATATAETEPTAAVATATVAPSPTVSVATAEPTATATATEPPTLASLVLAAADLVPPPLLPDFLSDELTVRQDVLGELPAPDELALHEFYDPDAGRTAGAAAVFRYGDADAARRAYGRAALELDGMGYDLGVSHPDGVGERATLEELQGRVYLAFARCRAFVFVWTTGARPFDVVAYAAALDELLAPSACAE